MKKIKQIKFKTIAYHSLTKWIAAFLCACAILTGCASAIIMLEMGETHPYGRGTLYERYRENVLSNYFAMLVSNAANDWRLQSDETKDEENSYSLLSGSQNLSYAVIDAGKQPITSIKSLKKVSILYATDGYQPDLKKDNWFEAVLYDGISHLNFQAHTLFSCFSTSYDTFPAYLENMQEETLQAESVEQGKTEHTSTNIYVLYHLSEGKPIVVNSVGIENDWSQYEGSMLDKALLTAYELADWSWWVYQNSTVLILCSLFVFLILLCYLTCAAGHRIGTEEIILRKTDKIWLGPGLAILFLTEYLLCALVYAVLDNDYFLEIIPVGLLCAYFFIMLIIIPMLIIFAWLSIVTRFKAGILFTQTACFKMGSSILNYLLWPFFHAANRLPMILKTTFLCLVLSFFQFIILAFFIINHWWESDVILFFFFLYKFMEIPLILYFTLHISKIRDGIHELAEGNYSTPIDTTHMHFGIKAAAIDLGKIRSGLSLAVKEQLKSERMKTELITNVSHDIKTPLTSIVNYIGLLEKEELNHPKAEEYIEVLHRQSLRLKKLIEDLIEASKASSGNLDINLSSCDTSVIMSQLMGEYEEKAKNAGIEIVITQPDTPIKLLADSKYLWRVFDNLLSNICKYSLPNTRAYIDVEIKEKDIGITFKNISKAPLNISADELMERFVRGDESRHTEGNGLGLSIAKNLTEHMGGAFQLTIDGDLFKITLELPKWADEINETS